MAIGDRGLKRAIERFLAGPGPAGGVSRAAARFLAVARAPEPATSAEDIDRALVAALEALTLAVERLESLPPDGHEADYASLGNITDDKRLESPPPDDHEADYASLGNITDDKRLESPPPDDHEGWIR